MKDMKFNPEKEFPHRGKHAQSIICDSVCGFPKLKELLEFEYKHKKLSKEHFDEMMRGIDIINKNMIFKV